jgi:hypothetical protein
MSELGDRIRAQQASALPMTVAEISEALWLAIMAHDEHEWEQVGRCVYCHDCGVRLYQGTIPPSHTAVQVKTERDYAVNPKAGDEMRKRWGKDA